MEHEEFDSELGKVAVSTEHVERKRNDNPDWERIEENFSSDELLDKTHFSKIESLEFQPESMFPNIKVETETGWKRMFFEQGDPAKECFKTLRYRWNAFRQNYS